MPDPTQEGPERENVRAVSRALRDLHRLLLFREAGDAPAAEVMSRAFSDPALAWLRPLSQMIVELDQLAELETVTEEYARGARSRVERLLETEEFTARFAPHGQEDHESAAALADVRFSLRELPPG